MDGVAVLLDAMGLYRSFDGPVRLSEPRKSRPFSVRLKRCLWLELGSKDLNDVATSAILRTSDLIWGI